MAGLVCIHWLNKNVAGDACLQGKLRFADSDDTCRTMLDDGDLTAGHETKRGERVSPSLMVAHNFNASRPAGLDPGHRHHSAV